jgi:hypothetical protein
VRAIDFHGTRTDAQIDGDLAIVHGVDNPVEDFALA